MYTAMVYIRTHRLQYSLTTYSYYSLTTYLLLTYYYTEQAMSSSSRSGETTPHSNSGNPNPSLHPYLDHAAQQQRYTTPLVYPTPRDHTAQQQRYTTRYTTRLYYPLHAKPEPKPTPYPLALDPSP